MLVFHIYLSYVFPQGLLITLCDNGFLYLWSVKEQVPLVVHTLEFIKNDRCRYRTITGLCCYHSPPLSVFVNVFIRSFIHAFIRSFMHFFLHLCRYFPLSPPIFFPVLSCRPSCISSHYKSDWLYVGSENGNVYLVNIPSFKISGYTIYWNHITGP